MLVDGNEAVERLRQAVDTGAAQTRQRDDTVDVYLPLLDEAHLPVDELGYMRRRYELDVAFLQQLADRRATRAPEELERTLLGRDERELDALDLIGAEMRCGQQRELVQRQRPDRTRGHDERDSTYLARSDLFEERADLVRVGRAAKGQCARNGRGRDGADRDEQVVVVNRANRSLRLRAGVDALKRAKGEVAPAAVASEPSS